MSTGRSRRNQAGSKIIIATGEGASGFAVAFAVYEFIRREQEIRKIWPQYFDPGGMARATAFLTETFPEYAECLQATDRRNNITPIDLGRRCSEPTNVVSLGAWRDGGSHADPE